MIDLLVKDLEYGLRTIRRSPGFTLVAVLSVALGIGANTAIFTLIDALLLRPLAAVRTPEQLVSVGDPARPMALRIGGPMLNVWSYPLYERLRDQNHVFSGLMASGQAGHVDVRIDGGDPEEVHGRLVSSNYFDVLGVPALLGRTFGAESEASPVAVISYGYWAHRFGRDPAILGKPLTLNGASFTVIGVAPVEFQGDVVGSPADIWIPISMQGEINRSDPRLHRTDSNWLSLMGRLKPGVSLSQARAEIGTLAHQAVIEYEGSAVSPGRVSEIRQQPVLVQPGATGFSLARRNFTRLLFMLMAVVGMVLLIACANIANLLQARARNRQKEILVRLAVGASRRRLVRQLLTESILLAMLGGAAGLLLAWWGSGLLLTLGANGSSAVVVDVRPNFAVLAFTLAASIFTGILFGLIPAMQASHVDLVPALRASARGLSSGGWHAGKLLVIGQVALSLVLLVGAGLLIRSLVNLETTDAGYSRTELVVLSIDPGRNDYTPQQQQTLMNALVGRLRSLPGVADASVSQNGLFTAIDSESDSVQVEGFTPVRKEDMSCSFDAVGPRYFQVLGAPILIGRDFNQRDNLHAPAVAIINDAMARFYFGGNNPVGKLITNGGDRYMIVGVVRDMKERNLRGETERRFYAPLQQSTDRVNPMNFEIRARGDAAHAIAAVRHELQAFDRDLKVLRMVPVRELMEQSIGNERLAAQLSGFFGALALLLAGTGLYGVMAYAMSRRTNEIGLRMALGASSGDVIGMVLRETLAVVGVGVAIGIPAALAATRLIGSMLEGVSANNPSAIGTSVAVVLTTGLLAGFIPAVRAARIDPMTALRQE